MGLGIGPGDRAEQLRRRPALAHRRHRPVALVRGLALERRPVDGPAVEPRRRPGLEARQRQAEGAQLVGERRRRPLADPAAGAAGHAEMELAAEEGAGGEHHRPGRQLASVGKQQARHPPALEPQGARFALDHLQPRLPVDQVVDRLPVAAPVGLDPGPPHRGALAGVEHPIVDRGLVRGAGDQAVIRVDLADEMALAEPAHRRVARHRADLVAAEADQGHRGAEPRRRGRGLGAGMAAADDDDVPGLRHRAHLRSMFHVEQSTSRCRNGRKGRRACPRRRPGR